MHEPEVVMLDEPTSGVDALARRAMWRRINELADRGDAVLVVTHYLDEAEQCNRLGFMADGELIAEGSPREIKSRMQGSLFEARCQDPFAALRALRGPFGHANVSLFGECLHVTAEDESGEAEIRAAIGQEADLRPIAFGLENVFLRLVEERRERAPQR
jgi:ABC-2 type transport system ATP-binding protein